MKKTTLLRKLLKEPGVLIVPTTYDCLSASLQEKILTRTEIRPAEISGS